MKSDICLRYYTIVRKNSSHFDNDGNAYSNVLDRARYTVNTGKCLNHLITYEHKHIHNEVFN